MKSSRSAKRRKQRRRARENRRRRAREDKRVKLENKIREEEEKKEQASERRKAHKSVESADKAFAFSIKTMTLPISHGTLVPHMEWDGTTFTPTKPSPPPRIDVSVSMMPAAHEKFGVKWRGS